MNRLPVVGEVIGIGAAASVQFRGSRKLVLRVVAVDARPSYHGWCWLAGYVLDHEGMAVEKREIFAQVAGLVLLQPTPTQPNRSPAAPQAARGVARRIGRP